MRYVALLRGINVGGNKKVGMKRLKALFESLGYSEVSTYINSGNVLFVSGKKRESVLRELGKALGQEFGFGISVLVKTADEMKKIAESIPPGWQNDDRQKSDVAYLFLEADSEKTVDELPIRKEFLDIRYVPGAILWNVNRKEYNQSRLNKIIEHRLYQFMTVRNVNTARFLAGQRRKEER